METDMQTTKPKVMPSTENVRLSTETDKLSSEISSTKSDILSTESDIPSTEQVTLSTEVEMPSTEQIMLTRGTDMKTREQVKLSTETDIPSTEKNMPIIKTDMPSTEQSMLSTETDIFSKEMSSTESDIPTTEQVTLSTEAADMSSTEQVIPSTETYMHKTEQVIISTETDTLSTEYKVKPIRSSFKSTSATSYHGNVTLPKLTTAFSKEGSGDVLAKLLLGNPELKKQPSLQGESIEKNPGDPKSNVKTKGNQLNLSNINLGPSNQEHMSSKSNQETSKDFKEPPIHTANSIQDDLLEKIKKGTNIMNIAPSDLVDFGGQKSFDMTHQLFIQHRGTFILMFDGRKGLYTKLEEYPQGDVTAASILEHWINSVLTYCNKTEDKMPRILFAATHSDSFSEDEQKKLVLKFKEELRKMFSLHKLHEHIMYDNVFFMNATDAADQDIERLKDTLVDIAFQQSTWGQQMPIVWVPLDLQILDMRAEGVKLITKKRLLEINKSNNEFALNERRVDDFLLVQHSIGKLLYFDEPALRDFIVIQPSAMVNILRAFVTDIMFWPEKGPVRDILENLSSTGVLKKTDLFTLWSQPAFKEILTDIRTKEYIVQVLLHLDILVEPKRYTETEVAADSFLVPCIVKENIPQKMRRNATDDKTLCIAYHLKETVVPSALSFKLIGAAISIWPLKVEDSRFCLYFQAAIMDADNRNELQIHVEGQRIIAYLINDVSKQLISPDLATTTQECLTLALERILQFYHRCFDKQSHHLMSDLFEIEVGEVCKGETCLLPLCDAKTRKSWICKNGIEHKTKISLNWVFDKNKETCDENCNGLGSEMLLLEPNDHHFVHLAQIMGIDEFREFLIHLGISTADYEKLNHCYFSNPMNFMLMGLFKWRDKAEIDQPISTFEELMRALTAIDRKHYLCKVQREDHSLMVKSHSRLQDVPSEEVIKALTQKNLIGDCVVHFGIELGLTSVDISKTLYNFQRDLDGQIHDLLMKWRKTDGKKPTIYWLMVALKRVQAVKGLKYVKKTYCVE
ncbi:Hypothetical predicted protein [Mytilus galloprovincialis]|uniref:Death domain-containing protein n=1 Tax=Mytilus galloprovincialis TaxID=29158 RepID=A0A8B6G981_MYTGA|nr:Hypothetical predicted protein [Mytilus galloprovincialis]